MQKRSTVCTLLLSPRIVGNRVGGDNGGCNAGAGWAICTKLISLCRRSFAPKLAAEQSWAGNLQALSCTWLSGEQKFFSPCTKLGWEFACVKRSNALKFGTEFLLCFIRHQELYWILYSAISLANPFKINLQKSILSFSPLPRLKPLSHFHPPRPLVVSWAQ